MIVKMQQVLREVLTESESLKSLENFYAAFQPFVKVSLFLFDYYDAMSINIEHLEISSFFKNYCPECEGFEENFEEIEKF